MNMKQPFEKVVAEHGATVLRVCRAVVGEHDADDAWSETFLAALGAWPDLPDGANVEAWLVTIAHRKAIDVARARQRRPFTVVAIEGLQERASGAGAGGAVRSGRAGRAAGDATAGGSSPEVPRRAGRSQPGHPDHDDAIDLWRAVGALPEKQRLAVAYHYLGGLAFADVAGLIGGSVEAARRASSDGVRALRANYADAAESTPNGAAAAGAAGHPLLHTEGLDR